MMLINSLAQPKEHAKRVEELKATLAGHRTPALSRENTPVEGA